MKRNKGFTLIELLAVIVILAIIALIATPTILVVIEKAKKGAAESSAYGYIDAVEKQIAINMLDSSKANIVDGVYETDILNSDIYGVKIKGNKPETTSWVKIEKNQVVDYSLKIGNYIVSYNTGTKKADAVKGDTVNNKPSVGVSYKCKRATTLHTEECTQTSTSGYCSAAGYTESGSKGTTTITYGNLGTAGVLTSGDAFTCDVNGDGEFDEATERFYYVSELSDNPKYAVLVYYNNTTAGVADKTSASLIAYDESNENWHGPVTGIVNLPTTTQWSNVSLSSTSRAITNESCGTTSNNGGYTLPTAFSYDGYAARLLTAQEVNSACGIKVGNSNTGELDGCNYLMENTKYSSDLLEIYGYWLEAPRTSNSHSAWNVYVSYRDVFNFSANDVNHNGVRPAIEVLKSDISY